MRAILLISLLFCTALVEARMYQWINPNTGSSQLSGKPPAWYRTEQGGPRVLVFEKSKLVDDTSLTVTEEQRVELHNRAFDLPDEEHKKIIQRDEAVAKLEKQIQELVESPEMAVYLNSPVPPEQTSAVSTNQEKEASTSVKSIAGAKPESQDERVNRLKALITAWETSQTESAKSIVESNESMDEEQTENAASEKAETKP